MSVRTSLALTRVGVLAAGVLLAAIPLSASTTDGAQTPKSRPVVVILHVADSIKDALWFRELTQNATAAAAAFDFEVENIFAGTDRPEVLNTLRERIRREPRPRYVIFANQRGLGSEMLAICDRQGVDAFLFSAPLSDEQRRQLGGPRQKLKHWIGELIPDDEKAGHDLAVALTDRARRRRRGRERLRMLGITGLRSTTSSRQRLAGMRRALEKRDDVELLQTVSAQWVRATARRKYELLIKRYGRVDVVWAANDPMALGVLDAAGASPKAPLVGGVDWIPPAIRAVSDGRMVVTLGGHFMDIALVMGLLRNHFDGADFAKIADGPSLRSSLVAMDATNVDRYQMFLRERSRGRIDYQAILSALRKKEVLARLDVRLFIETQRPR